MGQVRLKRLIILSITIISLLFILCIPVYGVHYTAYASVTASTSNINMLIETMFNQEDFNPFEDWIGIRTGQYDYSVFYNIDNDGNAQRLRYYGISSGYNIDYTLQKSYETNFTYSIGTYTITGSTPDSLGASSYRQKLYQTILTYSVPAILIVFLFFVFRIRKGKTGISL